MCQSTMSRDEYRALQERIKSEQPTACPQCASGDIIPTFEPIGGDWECQCCGALWSPDDE